MAAQPIRIMHVVRTLATGGTESVVRRLVSQLDPVKFQQSVCTFIAAPQGERLPELCLGRPADRPAFLVPTLTRVFRRERPDIVHSRNWASIEAVLAARIAGIRGIVHSEHGRDLDTLRPQPWRRKLLRRISYGCASRVFCVSEELREFYSRQLGMNADSFAVIPNGVDVEQFRPDSTTRGRIRNRLGIAPDAIVVGTVGRLDPVKDQATLLRAAHSAISQGKGVDLHLVIVGDGPQRVKLENELARLPALGRRTVFSGEVNNVSEWLNSFDIFVLPSLSEGMSNTLLEAMAVGIPSVATAVGGNKEVIEHGRSGFLVQSGDVRGIGEFLMLLAGSAGLRSEIGENARRRIVAQFSVERMLRRYEEMYCELTKPARAPASDGAKTNSYAQDL